MPRHQLNIQKDGRIQLNSAHNVTDIPLILEGALHLAADYISSVNEGHSETGCTTDLGREGATALLRFVAELVPNEYQLRDGFTTKRSTESKK